MPSVPGLVRLMVTPEKSATVSDPSARAADDVLVGRDEPGEVEGVGLLQRGDDQVARPAPARQVDGEAEVDVRRLDHGRLALDLGEVPVHLRVVGERPDHGVPDRCG